jgi:hypothetical protein
MSVSITKNAGIAVTISGIGSGLRKIGRDITIAAMFNIASLAIAAPPTLTGKFGQAALGTVSTSAGITLGRYIGGFVESLGCYAANQKCTNTGAAIGGTIGGLVGIVAASALSPIFYMR